MPADVSATWPPAIQPPEPREPADLAATYGVCRDCREPLRPYRAWTLSASGDAELRVGIACRCRWD